MRSFLPLLPLLLLPIAFSCSLNRTEESEKDRSMAQLNQRKYGDAVEDLEAKLRQDPSNQNTALLLAIAHIGQAHAEMLQLFTAVLSHQDNPPPELLASVKCDDEPWDSLKDKSVACVASRILRQVPDDMNPDMGRSQQLLRSYYNVPKNTKADVNFLAAYVEVYRLLNRFRMLSSPRYLKELESLKLNRETFDDITSSDFEQADNAYGRFVRELKMMGDEFMQVFRRLKYSYTKLAKYTASIDGKPILEYKSHVLIFDEDMTVSRVARFAIKVLNDEKGQTDERLNGNISGMLSRAMPEAVKMARRLRYVSGPGNAWQKITTSIQFERLLKDFLRGISGAGRAPTADLSSWMIKEVDTASEEIWQNPPGLFGDFVAAMKQSWDGETLRPLSAYHKATSPDWIELSEICNLWGRVRDGHKDKFEGQKMVKVLVERREADREYLKFPTTVTPKSINDWLQELVAEATIYERDYELGKFSSDSRPPSGERLALVHEAFTRSKAWLEKNVLMQRTPASKRK